MKGKDLFKLCKETWVELGIESFASWENKTQQEFYNKLANKLSNLPSRNKDYYREYYLNNRADILSKRKAYWEENKSYIKAKRRVRKRTRDNENL